MVMEEIEKMADVFKLLGDKTRLMVLALLNEKDLCVCEIVEVLKTSQPNISQHMRKLKDGGLVKETKKGQWVYYSLNIKDKQYILELFKQIPSQKDKVDQISCMEVECCD
jgi:ArsR family transcriptional regulator